jgi:hypothetical protein
VGPGSPLELGTPALILDVELGNGIAFSQPIPAESNAIVWMLQGKTGMDSNRRSASISDRGARTWCRTHRRRGDTTSAVHADVRQSRTASSRPSMAPTRADATREVFE